MATKSQLIDRINQNRISEAAGFIEKISIEDIWFMKPSKHYVEYLAPCVGYYLYNPDIEEDECRLFG